MIIVTGGTSGLGEAITKDLRQRGEQVVTISRRSKPKTKITFHVI